jgi:hypothetical protein
VDIICTCTACQAKFKVGEHAAGKKARCPKCKGVVDVPATSASSAQLKADSSAAIKRPDLPPVVRAVSPAPAKPAQASDASAPQPFVVTDVGSTSHIGRRKTERPQKNPLQMPLIIGGSVLGVLLLVVVAMLASGGGGNPDKQIAKNDLPTTKKAKQKPKADSPKPPSRTVAPVNNPKSDDGDKTFDFKVNADADEASSNPDPAPMPVPIVPGFDPTNPDFGPAPQGFDGWRQDFADAVQKAGVEKKNVLMVIGSSDANIDTGRLARKLKELGLPKGSLGEKFVPLVIDLPMTDEGAETVGNIRKNIKIAQEYLTSDALPIVVLVDEQGRPFAAQREWPNGFDDVTQVLETMLAKRAQRDQLLSAFVAAGDDDTKTAAAAAAMQWILDARLVSQYGRDIGLWHQIAVKSDPENKAGKLEVLFEGKLFCDLQLSTIRNPVQLATKLDLLDPWLKEKRFQDPDRGFRLHYLAARILIQIEDERQGGLHFNRAHEYEPKDKKLHAVWEGIGGASGKRLLSSGSGFVVAEGGYMITNRHVVEGKGNLAVRLPNVDEPVPAKVVKIHDDFDVALIKAEFPAGFAPRPLAIVTKFQTGMDVAAIGFPLGRTLGDAAKIVPGIVSSMPSRATQNMMLTNVLINGGNSGGPLCDRRGAVIGLITAKTNIADADSYGMAIPAREVDALLNDHLPKNAERGVAPPGKKAAMDWEEVFDQTSPSVLMIVKLQ